jgi:ribosomal protein L37E
MNPFPGTGARWRKVAENCRDCGSQVSPDAYLCPHCGAPRPAGPNRDGWGFEYRSRAAIGNWPLLHVSFKYRDFRPVPARGIIAIGQFAIGIVNISQFGAGVFSLGQFAVSFYAVAQFALAYSAIAQIGLVVERGYGQLIYFLRDLQPFF